jgi:hypothetical protein
MTDDINVLIPFDKMTITYTEEQDDGACITFNWDETDPDLAYWTSMSEDEQRSFVLTSLRDSLKEQLDEAS